MSSPLVLLSNFDLRGIASLVFILCPNFNSVNLGMPVNKYTPRFLHTQPQDVRTLQIHNFTLGSKILKYMLYVRLQGCYMDCTHLMQCGFIIHVFFVSNQKRLSCT